MIPVNTSNLSFKDYLLNNTRNRTILIIAGVAIIIQFTIFKYFYPFANYIFDDSLDYLLIAQKNADISIHMIGYGRFLRFFSVFSRSDLALTCFQYLLIQGSALLFLFTLFYFYRPGKVIQIILVCVLIISPLSLHLANLVSSDGLFLALSFMWVTLLLWIIYRPDIYLIHVHTLVVFIAFTVRYNALIYPAIATVIFLYSRQTVLRKITGITGAVILCGLFILYTGNKYRSLSGIWEYSPFSGWLIANNAMYAYRYVDSASRKPVPEKFRALDNMIREYFDSSRDVSTHPFEAEMAGTYYMWRAGLPLIEYERRHFAKDTTAGYLKRWAILAPLFKSYGYYIIGQYPWHYARYYLWYNALKYYAPPIELLDVYNYGQYGVDPVTQAWFGYEKPYVYTRTKDINIRMLNFYPILTGLINVVMFCCLLCFAVLNGFREKTLFRKGVLLAAAIWLLNAGFTIFASSAALRFQAFPIFLTTTFALLLVDWLLQMATDDKKSHPLSSEDNGRHDTFAGEVPAEVIA